MLKWISILLLSTFVWAESSMNLTQFQALNYTNASGESLQIPNLTKRLVLSFDQEGNGLMSAFLKTKSGSFLPSSQMVYIGDIGQMPSLITKLFAKPMMREYVFTIYLHEDKKLQEFVPHKPNKVTVIVFDEVGEAREVFFTNVAQQAFGLID